MDFSLSEEQQMLVDTLQRYLSNEYPFETRRRLARSEQGFSSGNWQAFADLGLLGLILPEEFAGMGASAVSTLIVMQQLGHALALEPFVSTAIIGASLVAELGTDAQRQAILPAVIEGRRLIAPAFLEPAARFDLCRIETQGKRCDGEFVLNGRKGVVVDGESADLLIVSARSQGGLTERKGISLFLIDASASGVQLTGFASIDGGRTAELELTEVRVTGDALLGELSNGYPALEKAIDRGIAALCAEALGVMESLLEITVEHLRTRSQFGQPIGSFQALQHRTADMLIATEQARAMAFGAAAAMELSNPRERRRVVSAAKSMIGRSGRFVAQQSIQLHGGMGMTDECAVGHYCKRLHCIDMTWGNSECHLDRYARLM